VGNVSFNEALQKRLASSLFCYNGLKRVENPNVCKMRSDFKSGILEKKKIVPQLQNAFKYFT
jgi:hypothetical protein